MSIDRGRTGIARWRRALVALRCACGQRWNVIGERRMTYARWADAHGICPDCCTGEHVAVDPMGDHR